MLDRCFFWFLVTFSGAMITNTNNVIAKDGKATSQLAQNVTPRVEIQELTFEGTPEYRSGQYVLKVDADPLLIGNKYRVRAKINSPTTDTLHFKAVKPSARFSS